MTATIAFRILWSRSFAGELSAQEIDVIEGEQDLLLRAAHLSNESTIGHRFVTADDATRTLIRVRRDFDLDTTNLELVTTSATRSPERWLDILAGLEHTANVIDELRSDANIATRPRIFIASQPAATPSNAEYDGVKALISTLTSAGFDASLPFEAKAGRTNWHDKDRASMLRADLVVIFHASDARARPFDYLVSRVSAAGVPLLILTYTNGRYLVSDLHNYGASGAGWPGVPEGGRVQDWLHSAGPHLERYAKTRRALFRRVEQQLPLARARLAAVGQAAIEESDVGVTEVFRLLAEPAEFATATIAEVWALQRLLGPDFVPKLHWEATYRHRPVLHGRADPAWTKFVAKPILSRPELDSLVRAIGQTAWSQEQVLFLLRISSSQRDSVAARHRELNSPSAWVELWEAVANIR